MAPSPLERKPGLFGTPLRTRVLVFIALAEETYPREIATLLDVPISNVQRVIEQYEAEGVLATRLFGRVRHVTLNPRWFARDALRAFLERYAAAFPDLVAKADGLRRRPRRAGKPIVS